MHLVTYGLEGLNPAMSLVFKQPFPPVSACVNFFPAFFVFLDHAYARCYFCKNVSIWFYCALNSTEPIHTIVPLYKTRPLH